MRDSEPVPSKQVLRNRVRELHNQLGQLDPFDLSAIAPGVRIHVDTRKSGSFTLLLRIEFEDPESPRWMVRGFTPSDSGVSHTEGDEGLGESDSPLATEMPDWFARYWDWPEITERPQRGYWIRRSDSTGHGHVLGGVHGIDSAVCPNCHRPLLQLASLHTSDSRLEMAELGTQRIPLLACFGCHAHGSMAYRIPGSSGFELLRLPRLDGGSFPYDDYPVSMPVMGCDLVPLTNEEQTHIERENEIPETLEPAHQVGGEAFWVQDVPALHCPVCRRIVPMFASIADDATDPRGFVGNPFSQTGYGICLADRVVVSTSMCD